MATAVQKIVLSSSRDIPFNKLVLSQSNVRRVKAGVSVEELAESIARRGLIQSLNVRPVLDADGAETGMYEVPAGGRRYQALSLLVKQKRLAKTAPVPCVVGDANSAILIDEVSLAENIERIPLHALDQFRAFLAMREKGMTEEEIAAAFFVSVQIVKQRLRLASVSPALLGVYAEDGMTLEMLMAFTVSSDHARQEQVWSAVQHGHNRQPWYIRQCLTETTVRASDKRVLFVGLTAYEQAGGGMMRDLFEADDGGWLTDPALLDKLVAEKLTAAAEEVASEGWKWITVDIDLPYGYRHGLRALVGSTVDMTEEEVAARAALADEYDRLESEYAQVEEYPEEVDQRLSELETALEAFETRPLFFDPVGIPIAGAFVSVDNHGGLVVDRGYVRPEDEPQDEPEGEDTTGQGGDVDGDEQAEPAVMRTVITLGGQPAEPEEDDEEDVIRPLPDRLLAELTAHRTLALREAVGANPHVAMTALLHKLVRDTFQRTGTAAASLQAFVHHVFFREQGKDLAETAYAQAVGQRHEDWKTDLPDDEDALWDWLAALSDECRMALLAHCVAYGVNALYEKPNPYGAGISQSGLDTRMAEADRLARATGLDMVEAGFRPTVDNYLGRVTKPRILAAVREGAGERAAQLIDHMKKGDMAKEAERLLADTGWLPEPLRLADLDGDQAIEPGPADEADLPEFLAGDDGDDEAGDVEDEDEEALAIAAE
jgi:ParB family chromosome partitioning protein